MKKTFDIFTETRGRSITSMYNVFRQMFDLVVNEHREKGISPIRFYVKGLVYYDKDGDKVMRNFPIKGSGNLIVRFEDINDTRFRLSNNENMVLYGDDFISDKSAFDMIFDSIFNRYGLSGIHSVMFDTDYIMTKEQGLEYYEKAVSEVFGKIDGKGDIDVCLNILVTSFGEIEKIGNIYQFGHVVEKNGDNRINIQLVSVDFGERIYDVQFDDGGNRVLRVK